MTRRACVFCGSSPGNRPAFSDAARELGDALARAGFGVVYGGAAVGLMGLMADAALAAGGEVIGVIPSWMGDRELAHRGLTELRVVDSMHARKAEMSSLASCFVALPGGLGTLDELFEIWTWALLGLHGKPIALVNVGGYFDPLLAFVDAAVADGLIRTAHRALVETVPAPRAAVELLAARVP